MKGCALFIGHLWPRILPRRSKLEMSRCDQLPFSEPVVALDTIKCDNHDLWFFLTTKNLYVRKVTMCDKKPVFHEQLTVSCFPGKESESKLTCIKLLVVPTEKDIHCLIATSVYALIKISMNSLCPIILQSHLANVSSLHHIRDEFVISCSEDNSVNGWDLVRGNLIFKYNFLYFHPAAIICSVISD